MNRPEVSDYQGKPILTLNPNERFKFSFGLQKAQLILDNLEAIKAFVATQGDTCDPAVQQSITIQDVINRYGKK